MLKRKTVNIEAETVNVSQKPAGSSTKGTVRSQSAQVKVNLKDRKATWGELRELLREAKRLGATPESEVYVSQSTMGYGYSFTAYPDAIIIWVPPHWVDEAH